MQQAQDITRLLAAHRQGDHDALDRVVELLYDELRGIAGKLRPRAGGTLDTGALLHEVYLKLARGGVEVVDREHFKAVAARAMRQIAVDHARTRKRAKRGGDHHHTGLDAAYGEGAPGPTPENVLTVHGLLEELAAEHPRMVQVVECRFFAGLNEEETAAALNVSLTTVQRDWRRARRLLAERMSD